MSLVLTRVSLEMIPFFFINIVMCYHMATVTKPHANQLNEILYNILLTKANLALLFLKLDPVCHRGMLQNHYPSLRQRTAS